MEKQAEQWSNSRRLKDFTKAAEEALRKQSGDSDFQEELEEWLSWARQHADRIDPLKNGFPWDTKATPEKS